MADAIPLGIRIDADTTRRLLLDLRRRVEAGEDLGDRRVHIEQVTVPLRRSTADLRLRLAGLDPSDPDHVAVRKVADATLALAEHNVEVAEKLLDESGKAS